MATMYEHNRNQPDLFHESDFLWGAKQIADFLGWNRRQVYRHQNDLPIGRLGGKMIASRSKLKDFLERRITEG